MDFWPKAGNVVTRYPLEQLDAFHVRHLKVGDDQIGLSFAILHHRANGRYARR